MSYVHVRNAFVAPERFFPRPGEWSLCLWLAALDLALWTALVFSIWAR